MTISTEHLKQEIYQRRAYYIAEGMPWPIIQTKLNEEFGNHPEELRAVRSRASKAGARTRKVQKQVPVGGQQQEQQEERRENQRVVEVQLTFDFG